MTRMKRLLAISPTPTHPPTAGNRIRILTLLEHLKRRGFDVDFLHVTHEKGDEAAMRAYWGDRLHVLPYKMPRTPKLRPWYAPYWAGRLLRAWRQGDSLHRRNLGLDDWLPRSLPAALRALHVQRRFDVVLTEYVYLSGALCAFPDGVLKLLDTHDVFADRFRRYLESGMQPSYYSCSARDEARGLDRADAVLAIQEDEARYFRAVTARPVLHAGHPVPVVDHGPVPATPSILFVGASNAINREALRRFCRDVLPLVLRAVPEAKLLLAGGICRDAPELPAVVCRGELPSLDAVYAEARCVVNLRHTGTGLSIKSIEALAHGRPLVATPSGAMGLTDGRGSAFLFAEGDDALARALVRVLKDDALAARLAAGGQAYARRYNERCLAELDAFLANYGAAGDE